jgi:hypothetical protein
MRAAAALAVALAVLISAASAAESVKLTVNGRDAAALVQDPAAERHADGSIYLRAAALAPLTGAQVDPSGHNVAWFEKFLHTRLGTTRFSCGPADVRDAGAAPVRDDSGLWLPARMLEGAFAWKIEAGPDGASLWTAGAALVGVRRGVHPDRIRIVIDLSAQTFMQVLRAADQVTISIPPPDKPAGTAGELRVFEFTGGNVQRVTQKIEPDGWTSLTIPYAGIRDVQVFSVADPARIVADFVLGQPEQPAAPEQPAQPAAPEQPSATPPKPAAPPPLPKPHLSEGEWKTMSWPTDAGGCVVHLFLFNPTGNGYELRPALGGEVVQEFASVKKIAAAHRAVAAVNGGFFSPGDRVPLGMLVIDGEWIRVPLAERPVFAVMNDGECRISRVEFDGRIRFTKLGALPVSGLNQNHWSPDSIVVFTRRWGARVPEQLRTTRLIVSSRGRVLKRLTTGEEVPVPAGGMVISGCGKRAASLTKVPLGCEVRLTFKTNPTWPHLQHALGGGPLLLENARIVLDPARESIRSDIASGRHARTAIGLTRSGRVLLAAAEGGKGGRGPGLTLTELAKMMKHLGCRCAMNLDGGGSTTFVVHDQVVTCCSDGSPRSVSNALLVVRRDHHPGD